MNRKKERKTFYIPIVWQMGETLTIEADSIEEAISLAKVEDLPDGIYIDDSFQIDWDEIAANNEGIKEKEIQAIKRKNL
jgi:ATP sulfurylase